MFPYVFNVKTSGNNCFVYVCFRHGVLFYNNSKFENNINDHNDFKLTAYSYIMNLL